MKTTDIGSRPTRHFVDQTPWERKFAWRPKTCQMSGDRIWLRYGYRRITMITGPKILIDESRWLTEECYLIEQLKADASTIL